MCVTQCGINAGKFVNLTPATDATTPTARHGHRATATATAAAEPRAPASTASTAATAAAAPGAPASTAATDGATAPIPGGAGGDARCVCVTMQINFLCYHRHH